MKRFILIFLLLVTKVYGDDWDFFQVNQKSFYQRTYFDASQPSTIIELFPDSVIDYTDSVKSYFLRKYHGKNSTACYENILHSASYNYFQNMNDADSMVWVGDTIRIYQNNFSSVDTIEFVFLRNAVVNQYWTIHASGNLFPDLRITCISSQSENFLGIPDSVKTFSLHGFNGISAVPSFYDTIQIKLSKNYGLLHFISFEYFVHHAPGTNGFTTQLVGFNNGILQEGFQPPVTTDFIHYHPGDVYLWKWQNDNFIPNPPTTDYYRDSIRQVSVNGDTIRWTYDTQVFDHTGAFYTVHNQNGIYILDKDFKDVFEAPTNSFVLGCVPVQRFGFCVTSGPYKTIVAAQSLIPDTLNGIPVISRNYNISGDVVDTGSCFVSQGPDATYSLSSNTLQGITEVCYTSFSYNCLTLIGSSINGTSTGIINIPLFVKEEQPLSGDIKIFPVPVGSELSVVMKNAGNDMNYKIINELGETLISNSLTTDKINVGNLNTGLYFLFITDGNKIYKEKFLKE